MKKILLVLAGLLIVSPAVAHPIGGPGWGGFPGWGGGWHPGWHHWHHHWGYGSGYYSAPAQVCYDPYGRVVFCPEPSYGD